MTSYKNKSIEAIEEKLEGVEEGSIRHRILSSAKNFKTSWIDLGQALYSVWKDKVYKSWGYATFDNYASKEIGIRKETALKLLRSYYFLEREEPDYLNKDNVESKEAGVIPNYESINVLRLAKNKKELDKSDYLGLRRQVLDMGKDEREVKKDLTALMKQREEISPEEARHKKKLFVLRRLLGSMKSMKREIEVSKLLPSSVLKDLDSLVNKIESQIG